jgi:O-antigen/teichoic acid export membrane protein
LSELLVFLQHANTIVVAPMAAKAHAHQSRSDLQHLFTLSAWANLLLTVPGALLLVAFGKFFLGLMGEGFEVAYVPLLVLLAGYVVRSLSGQLDVALNMTGNEALTARALAVCIVVNVVLNATLIPLYGALGAAIATASSVVVWRVILTVVVWKRLGVVACPLPMGVSRGDGDCPPEE